MKPLERWEGRTAAEWSVAWDVPEVRLYDSVGSTNDLGRQLAADGARPYTVVLAEEQVQGRGRSGDHWFSPPGSGIWMSVLLPAHSVAALPLLPLRVGLTLATAIETAADTMTGVVRLKWPNDLMVLDRKIAGILCEAGRPGAPVVAGMGINVAQRAQDFPESLRDRASSLNATLGVTVDRGRVAAEILRGIRWGASGVTASLSAEEQEEWSKRDWLSGRTVRLPSADGGTLEGRAVGVSPQGALRVTRDDGEVVEVRSGSVEIVQNEAAESGGRRTDR